MFIFKPIDREQFIERLVEASLTRPCSRNGAHTTQVETAVALNEEYDLTSRKSIIRWCELILSNKSMALIGIIDLLKQAKIVNYNC